MSFYNCGAFIGGVRAKSKKALRDALASTPDEVVFDGTSVLGRGPVSYTGAEVPEGVSLSVVGPDPFNSRRWYATVKLVNGKAKVTA
jgi:hypothetical protein